MVNEEVTCAKFVLKEIKDIMKTVTDGANFIYVRDLKR
jgi:hypothetical protein